MALAAALLLASFQDSVPQPVGSQRLIPLFLAILVGELISIQKMVLF